MRHATASETVSREPAANTEKSSEERRERMTTASEEKSEMAMEEVGVVRGR